MNKLSIYTLKALRKLYAKVMRVPPLALPACENDPDVASKLIYDMLMDDKPCMIARFGANELLCLSTYIGIKANNRNILSYIQGKTKEWWWNKKNLENMHYVAGFFPPIISKYENFCDLLLKDIPMVDLLGSWLNTENDVLHLLKDTSFVHLRLLEPYYSKTPWTKALESKRILVIHPFDELIKNQYKNKNLLFGSNLLPDFELITLKTVQSLAGEKTEFIDWFEALEYMKTEIDKIEFDICIVGAGAYGFHLAAHVKRNGKKAIHLGGATQLMFGIKGKRWDNPMYNVKEWGIPYGFYTNLFNNFWISPGINERPRDLTKVEGGCYW